MKKKGQAALDAIVDTVLTYRRKAKPVKRVKRKKRKGTKLACLLAVLCILIAGLSYAQSQESQKPVPPVARETKASDKKNHPATPKQEITVNLPSSVNVNLGGKLDIKSQTEQTRTDEEPNKWTDPITWFTLILAVANILLWLTTRDSAKSAKESADAAVIASMPVLSPLIVGGTLHPFRSTADILYTTDQPVTFESSVHFVFENFGKTPGMIREVRADLFLCEMDEFPVVDFEHLPLINYQPIIAGDSRGERALMGVAECTKSMTLTGQQFTELLAEASQPYRRFAFIGRVIYDDFFDNRHIRRFCVKTRLMRDGLFQLVRGNRTYNHIERQKAPND